MLLRANENGEVLLKCSDDVLFLPYKLKTIPEMLYFKKKEGR